MDLIGQLEGSLTEEIAVATITIESDIGLLQIILLLKRSHDFLIRGSLESIEIRELKHLVSMCVV
jgi:hypothetical protein